MSLIGMSWHSFQKSMCTSLVNIVRTLKNGKGLTFFNIFRVHSASDLMVSVSVIDSEVLALCPGCQSGACHSNACCYGNAQTVSDPEPGISSFDVRLTMPSDWFQPDDPCRLVHSIIHNVTFLNDVPLCLFLDTTGHYWFWPQGAVSFDFTQITVPSGMTAREIFRGFS